VTNCDGLLFLAGVVDGSALGHNRVVQLPAKSYTLSQIWAAAQVELIIALIIIMFKYH
jgi:hypothetical protein